MERKTSLYHGTESQTDVDGIPCRLVHQAVAEVDSAGVVRKIVGSYRRYEFLPKWRLRNLLKAREPERVVVSFVPQAETDSAAELSAGEEPAAENSLMEGKEGGPADGVYFITIEGDTQSEKASGEKEALEKARAAVRRAFFGS